MHLVGYLQPKNLWRGKEALAVTAVPWGHVHQARPIYLNTLKSNVKQRADLPPPVSTFIMNLNAKNQ